MVTGGVMITLSRRQCVTVVIGLLFSWMFFPAAMMSGFFPNGSAFALTNELILAFIVVLSVVSFFARKALERLLSQRSLLIAVAAINLVGYGLLWAHKLEWLTQWSVIVAALFLAASYICLMFAWAELLSSVESRQMMVLVFASVLGYAIFTLCDFMPTSVRMVICALSLSCSVACWYLAKVKPPTTFSTDVATLRHAPFLLLGVLAVLLIGGRIVGGLFFSLDSSISFFEMAIRCVCISAVMAIILFEIRHKPSMEEVYRNAWMPAAMAYFCGIMIILGLRGSSIDLGLGLMHGAISCFEALALLILFQFINSDRVSPVMIMSLGLPLFKAIPIALQRVLLSQDIVSDSLSNLEVAPIIILVSCAVLVCTLTIANHKKATSELTLLISDENETGNNSKEEVPSAAVVDRPCDPSIPQTMESPVPLSTEEACRSLAEEAGLSKREAEIMELIARGHSQKHISEVLYLALGTVQWYAKVIYRKLDVHSKQELINKVSARREQ